MRSKFGLFVALLVIVGMIASCTPQKPAEVTAPTSAPAPVVEAPTAAPAGPTGPRTGGWLDEIVVVEEPSSDAGVSRLESGDLDGYWYTISDPALVDKIKANPDLKYFQSYGSYNELTFNPSGPVFEGTGKLNPFAVPAIREAMNWLIDREYIAQEIMGGLAKPRWTAFNNASGDYAMLADVCRKLEIKYAYDKDKATEIITAEMENLGATLVDGKWQYEGAPVELTVLIRTEDERRQIGDYVSNQLEDIGFTVTRDYKPSADASPIWMRGNPADGQWNIYTGGWVTTAVPRDLGSNFPYFYTDMGLPVPLWQAYQNTPEFYDVCNKLNNNDFKSVEERAQLMSQALELSLQDSNRIWLVDRGSATPVRAEDVVAADLYGGVAGAWLWPVTLRREGEEGGSMTIGQPSILTEPWNPVAGTNWIYDMTWIRGTGEDGYIPDPYTGLRSPRRYEKAEVTIQEGLPVGKTLDWVDLKFAPKIEVPDDAWVDWDAKEQRFLTASEVYTETQTALRKIVVYYPDDLYDTVTWHDGSKFSIGDIVMAMIQAFDCAKEDSPYYDESAVPAFESFMSAFKGVKIISEDPLVIETYSDLYYLDAEEGIDGWWPYYDQGEASWPALAIGLMADGKGLATFSAGKADELQTEWMSYIAGPTVQVLADQLDEAMAESFIPYEPTLGQFVTAEEMKTRYENYKAFYDELGHFWVGTGPYYLERAYPVEGTLVLKHFDDYPDLSTRWEGFSGPKVPEVDVDGPDNVTVGQEASFDVYVTFEGDPYPTAELDQVKFLVVDANNEVAYVGAAEAAEDGLWTATLDADTTGKLVAGSNKLEVIVVSKLVAVPGSGSMQFVTAP